MPADSESEVTSKARSAVTDPDRFVRKNYFPTMIFQYDIEDSEQLNKTLLELVYAEREQGVAVNKSNTAALGSWHSATGLHKNPAYEPLLTEVNAAFGCDLQVHALFDDADTIAGMARAIERERQ